jgi:exopolysaccharide biosynthesis polyprenyl glycosylphosphotransferase
MSEAARIARDHASAMPATTPVVRPRAIPSRAPIMKPKHRHGRRYVALFGDILVVLVNGIFVFSMRFSIHGVRSGVVPVGHYLGFLILYTVLVTIFCQNQGLYDAWRAVGPLDESFSIARAVALASLLLVAFIYLSGDKSISRLVVGLCAVLNAAALAAWRLAKRKVVTKQVASGRDGRHILIVGTGDVGQSLARHLSENPYLGYAVKGMLDAENDASVGVSGTIKDFSQLAMLHFIDEVFITAPTRREIVDEVLLQAREMKIDVKVVPDFVDGLGWFAPIRYVGEFPVMELLREPIPAIGLLTKRVIDVACAAVALFFLSPILALIALCVRLDSRGSVIYRSTRIGKKGRKFICYKFRTMVTNADELKRGLQHMNERQGPIFKITNDPRITRIGGFLRRYSLDELPQFWNVLKGDMSLVGPRPHPLDDFEKYRTEDMRRLDVKPGVTGLWQVYARTDPSFERNLALDLEYIEHWSLWLDLKILIRTLPVMLTGSGR